MNRKISDEFSRLETRLSSPKSESSRSSLRKTASSLLKLSCSLLYRLFEIAAALLFILIFTLPVLLFRLIMKIFRPGGIFEICQIYGKDGVPLKVLMLRSEKYYVRKAPLFFHVITGLLQISFQYQVEF